MLLAKLAYFSFSGALFFFASYPFLNDLRNQKSFFSNLRRLQRDKRRGSTLLALAFYNVLLAASLFFLGSNTD
jgi:hypothetical protein